MSQVSLAQRRSILLRFRLVVLETNETLYRNHCNATLDVSFSDFSYDYVHTTESLALSSPLINTISMVGIIRVRDRAEIKQIDKAAGLVKLLNKRIVRWMLQIQIPMTAVAHTNVFGQEQLLEGITIFSMLR